MPASRFIPAAALRTSARLSRDQSFRRFSSVRQEVWLSQNTHVVFSGESAFVNASNGLSNQPFSVGGTKNKSPATSVTRLSYVYPSSISFPRKFAATKGFIENISYSCSTHSYVLRKP